MALSSVLASAAACTLSTPGTSTTSTPAPAATTTGSIDAGDGGGAGLGSADDAGTETDAAAAPSTQNNLLCVVISTCDPDTPETPTSCHLAPDGGAYDPSGGYADAGLACRVQPSTSIASNGLGLPTTCSVSGPGIEGASCKQATDCTAGLECVGTGVCRHYCCAGNAQCTSDQFCDVQSLASASTTKVPVCMPIEPSGGCSLWPRGQCAGDSTCAIVREDGTTGCVEIGPKMAGESCDVEHCAAGLVCLGALNARLCYALCDTSVPQCTAPQSCQGGLPLFQDPKVGVCR